MKNLVTSSKFVLYLELYAHQTVTIAAHLYCIVVHHKLCTGCCGTARRRPLEKALLSPQYEKSSAAVFQQLSLSHSSNTAIRYNRHS